MSQNTAWLLLVMAGIFDVLWAVSMKYAAGYTRPGWTVVSLIFLAAFVFLLGRSLKALPVGTAYAVWTGIGAGGSFLLGVLLFGEEINSIRLCGIGLIVIGIVLLKLASS